MGRTKPVTGRRLGGANLITTHPIPEPWPTMPVGPQNQHVLATAVSAQVRSHDDSSILVEAGSLDPMRWFLEHGSQASGTAPSSRRGEPSLKRRKLNVDDSQGQNVQYIPLYEATVDLHFPETLSTKTPSEKAIADDVKFENAPSLRVSIDGIQMDDTGTIWRLSSSRNSPVLILESSQIPQSFVDFISSIKLPPRGVTVKDCPASRLTCTLTKSVGEFYTVFRLKASYQWQSGTSAFPLGAPGGVRAYYLDYDLMLQAYPDYIRNAEYTPEPWTPQDFYSSLHAPSKDLDVHDDYDHLLETELYPFQKRAVSWMLGREGIRTSEEHHTPGFHQVVKDADGRKCFVSHVQGIIARDRPDSEGYVSGGILAEEMGLGKTVEIMALLSLNRRPATTSNTVHDVDSGLMLSPSRATLIITPATILQQWQSELSKHAPHLSVHHYQGIPKGHTQKQYSEKAIIEDLAAKYDVVLTTYHVIGKEVHFTDPPPDRSLRHASKHERKKSPLMQVQWWRICLDEAQMVESGVSAAARVACRLPRVHSWAVSGTPLRKDLLDIHGLLIFLRFKPFNGDSRLWGHLVRNHKHLLSKIFGNIALRHTKALIRDELRLPLQKRVVVSCPFSVVEQQNYATLFEQMCDEVGLNTDGSPRHDDWSPQNAAERMRSWLSRLRQTCLHPQVGGRNRKALGRRNGPLRTVAEVLEVMIEQNETDLRFRERDFIAASLKRAHILGNNGADQHRSEKALKVYEEDLVATERMVKEARARLATAKEVARNKGEAADTEEEDGAEESNPVLGRMRNALRTSLQLHHACLFFAATAYHQIKSNEDLTEEGSDQYQKLEVKEVDLYEQAKTSRKEIMRATASKAEALMRQLQDLQNDKQSSKIPKIKDLPGNGGIESRKIVEKSDELFEEIRKQADLLLEWRSKIVEFLLKPLVDEENEGIEMTGDEYEDSTKQQDELYVYFDAIKSVHADLNTLVTGVSAPLIDHETKMLVRAAKNHLDDEVADEFKDGGVHAPELAVRLLSSRVSDAYRKRRDQLGSIRGLIAEARSLESSVEWALPGSRAGAEHFIAKHILSALQSVLGSYSRALTGFEKEIDLFRDTQNQRVEFYRQLQQLSDDVAPYKDEHDPVLDHHALENALNEEEHINGLLAQARTKNRFLVHLKAEEGADSESKVCIICRDHFERGVLTVCGHQFCKECISHWFTRARTCPVCKRGLTKNDVHDITFKPAELRAAQEEATSSDSSPSQTSGNSASTQTTIYSDVDPKLMDEIKSVDLPNSYGSKIDTLGRHLHWIREHDPGAKSIVFSQYREFFDVLSEALKEFKIGHTRLGRPGAAEKFRNDPSIDCLLLDAKTDSSGLTLVNATHVILMEPLVNTALELQAIARVHRIGQTRATTVWMYLINETVEGAIYDISVNRRLSHVQSKREQKSRSATPGPFQEVALDAANSDELQSAPLTQLLAAGKTGGEIVGNDDLWQCLFGKARSATSSTAASNEVGRHLRAEAAEARREGGL